MILQRTHAHAREDARLLIALLEKLATEERPDAVEAFTREGAHAATKLARYLRSFRAMHGLYWDRPSDGLPF